MGKYISGVLNCKIEFHDLYVDEGDNNIDAIFPNGWEEEMIDYSFDILEEYEE